MFDYISKFLKNVKPNDWWWDALGILNLLHVIEILLVTSLANAESERGYSCLWRNFSKERSSLKNIKRGDTDYSDERYCDVIEMFLKEYPDGTVRKKAEESRATIIHKTRRFNKRQRKVICSVLDAITSSSDEDSTPATSVQEIPHDDIDDSDEWPTSSHEEF